MRKIFFCSLLIIAPLFGGREFMDQDYAFSMLNNFKCRAYSIRTQLNYGVKFADYDSISSKERMEQLNKFDVLWVEFEDVRVYLQKNIKDLKQKECFSEFVATMRMDKARYDKERKSFTAYYAN